MIPSVFFTHNDLPVRVIRYDDELILCLSDDAVRLSDKELLGLVQTFRDHHDEIEIATAIEGRLEVTDEELARIIRSSFGHHSYTLKAREMLAQRAIPESEDAGYVYLYHSPTYQRYKIGMSIKPRRRAREISKEVKGYLVHTFPADDMRAAERQLHEFFESCCIGYEWFSLTPEQIATITHIRAYRYGIFL